MMIDLSFEHEASSVDLDSVIPDAWEDSLLPPDGDRRIVTMTNELRRKRRRHDTLQHDLETSSSSSRLTTLDPVITIDPSSDHEALSVDLDLDNIISDAWDSNVLLRPSGDSRIAARPSEHRRKRQRHDASQHSLETSTSSPRLTTLDSAMMIDSSPGHKTSSAVDLDSLIPDARDLDSLQPPDGDSRIVCYGMASQHYLKQRSKVNY